MRIWQWCGTGAVFVLALVCSRVFGELLERLYAPSAVSAHGVSAMACGHECLAMLLIYAYIIVNIN